MAHLDLPPGVPGILGPLQAHPNTARPLLELAEVLLRPAPGSSLPTAARELIATSVSAHNGCAFCRNSHAEVARLLWGERAETVDAVIEDPETADVGPRLTSLLRIASAVALGGRQVRAEAVAEARDAGASDADIHDTVLIAAAFCMFNRYVDGLDTPLPEDPAAYGQMTEDLVANGYRLPGVFPRSTRPRGEPVRPAISPSGQSAAGHPVVTTPTRSAGAVDGAPLDVVVVGAGAAGIGIGVLLRRLGLERFVVLERHEIGASFRSWPAETRFITPSFPGNQFGAVDLNAVTADSSPALGYAAEHLSGPQHAGYLTELADAYRVPVVTGLDVHGLARGPGRDLTVLTDRREVHTHFVVWAAGEYQYPRTSGFPGAALCRHSATVDAWARIEGDQVLIVGGYESGIDAAVHLAAPGRQVVVDAGHPWEVLDTDPSVALSPFTHERLRAARRSSEVVLEGNASVTEVCRDGSRFVVCTADGRTWTTLVPPILATGFEGSLSLVAEHFDRRDDGHVVVSEHDESTRTPGLFLVAHLYTTKNTDWESEQEFRIVYVQWDVPDGNMDVPISIPFEASLEAIVLGEHFPDTERNVMQFRACMPAEIDLLQCQWHSGVPILTR